MGGKPRINPLPPEEFDEDGLIVMEPITSPSGKHKTVGIITNNIGGEVIEVKIHRKPHAHSITAMGITRVNFKRVGRGMAAMSPDAQKELVIIVRYKDGS